MYIRAYYDGKEVAEQELPDSLMEADRLTEGMSQIDRKLNHYKREMMISSFQKHIAEVLFEKFEIPFKELKWEVEIGSKLNKLSDQQIDQILK